MTIWFLLTLALIKFAAAQDQEYAPAAQIIRTAPVVIPCWECLKNSRMNLGNPGCGCGCGGGGLPLQVEDSSANPPAVLEPQDDGAGWCSCCGVDDQNQNTAVSPSFSVAMLAPLASVLTSFMGGIGNNNGDEAVTVSFDDQTSNSGPSGDPQCEVPPYNIQEYPPAGPQCEAPPYNIVPPARPQCEAPPYNIVPPGGPQCEAPPYNIVPPAGPQCEAPPYNIREYPPSGHRFAVPPYNALENNQTIMYGPPPSPVPPKAPRPVAHNRYPPQRFPVTGHKPSSGGCQCYKKHKKQISDIEEDSIYAFAQNNPENRCSCNSFNQGPAFGHTNRYSQDIGFKQKKMQMYSTNDLHQPNIQKDNNHIYRQPTGNPEFDSISRLSAIYSSQKNNLNSQTNNQEQNIMPCQCCC